MPQKLISRAYVAVIAAFIKGSRPISTVHLKKKSLFLYFEHPETTHEHYKKSIIYAVICSYFSSPWYLETKLYWF